MFGYTIMGRNKKRVKMIVPNAGAKLRAAQCYRFTTSGIESKQPDLKNRAESGAESQA